jgi:hypothetical protein
MRYRGRGTVQVEVYKATRPNFIANTCEDRGHATELRDARCQGRVCAPSSSADHGHLYFFGVRLPCIAPAVRALHFMDGAPLSKHRQDDSELFGQRALLERESTA